MAKKHLSKRERKAQEKARKKAVRQRTGWQEEQPSTDRYSHALSPLMSSNPDKFSQNVMETIGSSDELIDEPEMADLIWSPIDTVGLFIKEAEDQGLSPDTLFGMPDDARFEKTKDIMVAILPQLYSKAQQKDLLARLDALISRRQEKGQEVGAAQAAAVHMILSDRKQQKLWPELPIILALTERSLNIGFEWLGLMDQINEAADGGSIDQIGDTPLAKKVEELMQQYPALAELANAQLDTVWEDGLEALREGEIYLGLFHGSELATALEIMKRYWPVSEENTEPDTSNIDAAGLADALQTHLNAIVTPERLAEMQQIVDTAMEAETLSAKHAAFLSILSTSLAEEDALDVYSDFFFNVILGETAVYASERNNNTDGEAAEEETAV